jgi:hypothetical protein
MGLYMASVATEVQMNVSPEEMKKGNGTLDGLVQEMWKSNR